MSLFQVSSSVRQSETQQQQQPASVAPTFATYRRALSPNELSYFLPSRAYGLNDMFIRITLRAPPNLITPHRLHIIWAILRLRHSLMASRVEMKPGAYDDAHFTYIPPSSPNEAIQEASASVRVRNGVPGSALVEEFLNGPARLGANCLARLEVGRGDFSRGMHEYNLVFSFHHMINDARGVYAASQFALELLGGSTPTQPPLTDSQLAKVLEKEWKLRWAAGPRDLNEVIIPSTELRILRSPPTKFQEVAWKVDQQNVQKRFIGGHAFPKARRPTVEAIKTRLIRTKFNKEQTIAIFARCKAECVTLQSAVFGLINMAWIRLFSKHSEIPASTTLPMLMYTAISLRGYLPPVSELSSFMSLALGYHNLVLPSFLPSSTSPKSLSATFWARSREAQRQMFSYSHNPMLLGRSVVAAEERGQRAKAWARIDDEAAGILPRRASPPPTAQPSVVNPASQPSVALLGVSQSGNIDGIFRREHYPLMELCDVVGGTRKGPGGLLVYTRTVLEEFNLLLLWDSAPFDAVLMDEFWQYVVDGVHEYILENPSLKGTAYQDDCAAPTTVRAQARL
ncbi:hypothetical protein MIND_00345800 [Mycena indigotica]|uniref:Uncharacterized protein n=1 Tax=Mycena indigotica TaxID=2126181 RepID=A0A8H6T0K0_9AGAR|nr:uncharacterized protein MIND_00345800 [Mycena indigotica]KAF7309740.1 hypothetical protein MIND_00345800 [Mycena indigotica]